MKSGFELINIYIFQFQWRYNTLHVQIILNMKENLFIFLKINK